jgi:membrane protease YdiL (CAAX protease family)
MPQIKDKAALWVFFLLTFMITWSCWIPLALEKKGYGGIHAPVILMQSIGAYGPHLALFLTSILAHNRALYSKPFSSIPKSRKFKKLAVLAAVLPLVVAVVTSIISWLLERSNLTIFKPQVFSTAGTLIAVYIPLQFVTGLFGSPLGEEPGWRGFALPRLREKFGPLAGSLTLGTIWYIWHIPLHIALGVPVDLGAFLQLVLFSILIDILFTYTDSNLLIAMLVHQGISTKFSFFAADNSTVSGLLILAIFVLLTKALLKQNPAPKLTP